jgi:hypothetical protein
LFILKLLQPRLNKFRCPATRDAGLTGTLLERRVSAPEWPAIRALLPDRDLRPLRLLMAAVGWAFAAGWLTAWEQTAAWTVIFFFASAAASAAYLTVGESFPLEMRAIALFYALGTALGGVGGPALFGLLIQTGERGSIMWATCWRRH